MSDEDVRAAAERADERCFDATLRDGHSPDLDVPFDHAKPAADLLTGKQRPDERTESSPVDEAPMLMLNDGVPFTVGETTPADAQCSPAELIDEVLDAATQSCVSAVNEAPAAAACDNEQTAAAFANQFIDFLSGAPGIDGDTQPGAVADTSAMAANRTAPTAPFDWVEFSEAPRALSSAASAADEKNDEHEKAWQTADSPRGDSTAPLAVLGGSIVDQGSAIAAAIRADVGGIFEQFASTEKPQDAESRPSRVAVHEMLTSDDSIIGGLTTSGIPIVSGVQGTAPTRPLDHLEPLLDADTAEEAAVLAAPPPPPGDYLQLNTTDDDIVLGVTAAGQPLLDGISHAGRHAQPPQSPSPPPPAKLDEASLWYNHGIMSADSKTSGIPIVSGVQGTAPTRPLDHLEPLLDADTTEEADVLAAPPPAPGDYLQLDTTDDDIVLGVTAEFDEASLWYNHGIMSADSEEEKAFKTTDMTQENKPFEQSSADAKLAASDAVGQWADERRGTIEVSDALLVDSDASRPPGDVQLVLNSPPSDDDYDEHTVEIQPPTGEPAHAVDEPQAHSPPPSAVAAPSPPQSPSESLDQPIAAPRRSPPKPSSPEKLPTKPAPPPTPPESPVVEQPPVPSPRRSPPKQATPSETVKKPVVSPSEAPPSPATSPTTKSPTDETPKHLQEAAAVAAAPLLPAQKGPLKEDAAAVVKIRQRPPPPQPTDDAEAVRISQLPMIDDDAQTAAAPDNAVKPARPLADASQPPPPPPPPPPTQTGARFRERIRNLCTLL